MLPVIWSYLQIEPFNTIFQNDSDKNIDSVTVSDVDRAPDVWQPYANVTYC